MTNDKLREAYSTLVKVAAELCTKGVSPYREDHPKGTIRTVLRQVNADHERRKELAIQVRRAADTMNAALAASVEAEPVAWRAVGIRKGVSLTMTFYGATKDEAMQQVTYALGWDAEVTCEPLYAHPAEQGKDAEDVACGEFLSWVKAEGSPPPCVGDQRKLCWLEQDGMAWVGIRVYRHDLGAWCTGNEKYPGNRETSERVVYWMNLPGSPYYPPHRTREEIDAARNAKPAKGG